jgi:hypothetical protein
MDWLAVAAADAGVIAEAGRSSLDLIDWIASLLGVRLRETRLRSGARELGTAISKRSTPRIAEVEGGWDWEKKELLFIYWGRREEHCHWEQQTANSPGLRCGA